MSFSKLFPQKHKGLPSFTQPSVISAWALEYLQCLHRTPRLLDPSGSLDITPRHSISAEFKQRP